MSDWVGRLKPKTLHHSSTTTKEEETLERTPQRAQVQWGQPIHQPVEMDLRRHLIFEDRLEKERYEKIYKLPIVPGKSTNDPTLDTLNIKTGVSKLIYAIS